MTSWFAVYTKPRNEKKVADRLSRAGIEHYLPLREEKRKWSDRYKTVKVPVISSYVFIKTEEKDRQQILQDPGILNFVFWLGKPAQISEEEIQLMKLVLGHDLSEYELEIEQFNPGEKVEVEFGSFSGVSGEVLAQSKKEVSVILKQLGIVLRLTPLHLKRIK